MNSTKLTIILIIGAIGVLGLTTLFIQDGDNNSNTNEIESTIVPTQREEAVIKEQGSTNQTIDLATYAASLEYRVPEHRESISVSLDLEGTTVKDYSIDYSASPGDSQEYQERFANSISSELVGKDINEISVSRIGGASLTTQAFMDAIEDIKNQVG